MWKVLNFKTLHQRKGSGWFKATKVPLKVWVNLIQFSQVNKSKIY